MKLLWFIIVLLDILDAYTLAVTNRQPPALNSSYKDSAKGRSEKKVGTKSERKRHHRVSHNGRRHHVIKIHLNTRGNVCRLDKRFLSFTIDALEMSRKFRCFPLRSAKLNSLAKALSPAYLRVGGTPQDFATFMESAESENSLDDGMPVRHSANSVEWDSSQCKAHFQSWTEMKPIRLPFSYFADIAHFAERNGLRLIFGLNALHHRKAGAWDPTESLKLFDYTRTHDLPVEWELGNEPNRYVKYGKNWTLTPSQLADDYRKLGGIVKPGTIVGPSIAKLHPKALKYLKTYLEGKPAISALTYHHYFFHQTKSTLEKYLDPYYLEELEEKMYAVKLLMNITGTKTDLWLGEAGSSSGGGANGLSNTYAAGFFYLGTLGLASKSCHKVVIRQSFYGGYYGMLGSVSHDPLPDYWTSLLFKQLVGEVALKTHHKRNKLIKIHAYCTRNMPDDITIMAVNYDTKSVKFTVNGYQHLRIMQYVLTPFKGDMQSNRVCLNGKVLAVNEDYSLPKLVGRITKQPFSLPKTSYGFFVVKNAKSKVCRTS